MFAAEVFGHNAWLVIIVAVLIIAVGIALGKRL